MTIPARSPGLTGAEVAERIAAGKTNDVPRTTGRSTVDIVRANVFTRINAILSVLLAIVLTTGSLINAAFGLLIVANSIIGIVQELRAKKTLDSLAVVGQAKPVVRRDGVETEVDRTDVVLDDVIVVGPGDQIVVDGTVVEDDQLEIDESLLTGEADPIAKDVGDDVMSGSFVTSGGGAYRATRVGRAAYAAQLTAEASKFTLVKSELRSGINSILKFITWLLVPVGIATIWTQLVAVGTPWRESVLQMVGALVPMVPEGLVLMTSIAFALGVVRLGRRQCLVQELPAIEGLARVDVVCADKTGTLTETGMTLVDVIETSDLDQQAVRDILGQLRAADLRPNASMKAIGDGLPRCESPWPVRAYEPFNSTRKWSGASFDDGGDWVLGAPDVLGEPGSAAATRAEQIGAEGLRVLMLGRASCPVDDPAAPGTVDPVGLVVLGQKVRPDAGETLDYFRRQGVSLKVISGDNAGSVAAVTRSLGMVGAVVDARDLDVDADDFPSRVDEAQVFGRVTPDQKRRMVGALHGDGHTVAMTGDGVNDVLALKDADIGVAMGSGSPATRSVAQIVLLDNKFATLPHVVGEGRRVIGNIERVANLFLTKTVYSVLLALLVVIWQIPFPFQPIHVTITGWFTIGIPAFLLSLAPNNERAKPNFVKRVMRLGLPAGVIVATTAFTTYVLLFPGVDADPTLRRQASTAALAALILAATAVLSVVARPFEWWKLALVAISQAAYLLIFTLPFTQKLFLLDATNGAFMRTGLIAGFTGALAVEATWWVTGWLTKDGRHLWARPED